MPNDNNEEVKVVAHIEGEIALVSSASNGSKFYCFRILDPNLSLIHDAKNNFYILAPLNIRSNAKEEKSKKKKNKKKNAK